MLLFSLSEVTLNIEDNQSRSQLENRGGVNPKMFLLFCGLFLADLFLLYHIYSSFYLSGKNYFYTIFFVIMHKSYNRKFLITLIVSYGPMVLMDLQPLLTFSFLAIGLKWIKPIYTTRF